MHRILVLFSIAVFSSAAVDGQILPLHTYTVRDGLLTGNVSLLHQDRRGFIWIGSSEGLTVYDGARFASFSASDGLPYTQIFDLAEDSNGVFWLATLEGLRRYDGSRFQLVWPESSLSGRDYLHACAVDPGGAVWFAGYRGLFRMRGGHPTRMPFVDGVAGNPHFAVTPDGVLWIVANEVLLKYSLREDRLVSSHSLSRGGIVRHIRADDDSSLWVLMSNGTISRYKDGALLDERHRLMSNPLFHFDDHEGNIWIGGSEGIARIRKSQFAVARITRFNTRNGIPQNLLWCGMADREGNLWFGTNKEGLVKLAARHLTAITLPFQYRLHNNGGATVDSAAHLWIATDEGLIELFREESGEWQQFDHHITHARNPVQAVQIDRTGRLWVDIPKDRLTCYSLRHQSGKKTTLTPTITLRPGIDLPAGSRYALAFDYKNKLWFSIPGVGVGRIDPERRRVERFYTEKDGDFLTSIRAIMIDRNENVWLGDFWRGVAVVSAGDSVSHIRHYTRKEGLPGDGIRALHEASDGKIWIGTRYNGIAVYHDGRFSPIGMDEGMRSNAVWSLTEDSGGTIWAGTSIGLQAISGATLKPLRSVGELAEPVSGNCGFLPDGTLWGISADRLLLYEPHHDVRTAVPPPIHLTRAFVNETPVTPGEENEFAHGENNWRIEFIGLSFRDERAVRYTYRLKGLDDRWREPTALREVTYASLAPGRYAFEVKAITKEGVESTIPATLRFVINPPIWSRWWFVASALLMISGTIAMAVRARVRRLLEIERIRTGIATDLHDDIGSGLTRIAILSEMAAKQATPAARAQPVGTAREGALLNSLEKMGAFARELHDAMSDVVWSIDPQHDTLEDVARRLREFATEVCQENDIHLRDLLAAESLTLGPELLRAVLLIGKEALTNTARHAECTTLAMSLKVAGSDIILVVEDNGTGFQMNALPRVNGLANMRRRAEKVGGTLLVQSAPGEGTRVEAHIPIRRKPEHLFS